MDEIPPELPEEIQPQAEMPSPQRPLLQRVPWRRVGTVVVILLLIVGGYYAFKPERHKVHGVIAVVASLYRFQDEGSTCAGSGGYDDMHAGTQIVVKDQAEHVIATSALDKGLTLHDPNSCAFTFSVSVPGASFYNFEIGHRSPVSYSKSEMAKNKWSLILSLGG